MFLFLYLKASRSSCLSFGGYRSFGVNMASDNDNDEDFVSYGTPLEPLEEGITNLIMSINASCSQGNIATVFWRFKGAERTLREDKQQLAASC